MIRLIAAIDRQRGIAKQGFQPWKIPDDELYFAEQTKSHGGQLLVGGTTFKLIGALPDRTNFVLTRDKDPLDGATPVHDLKKFLEGYRDHDLWVIGGANVYGQVLELGMADELYLTEIEADFGCNQFFPEFSNHFLPAAQGELREENGFIYRFNIYRKP